MISKTWVWCEKTRTLIHYSWKYKLIYHIGGKFDKSYQYYRFPYSNLAIPFRNSTRCVQFANSPKVACTSSVIRCVLIVKDERAESSPFSSGLSDKLWCDHIREYYTTVKNNENAFMYLQDTLRKKSKMQTICLVCSC